ncbi:hypothetical protein [Pseudomonas savastanoi]|uniref:hypothetical protein n=1 Tax=Pseudomonas savastanoi TaxID=29438 RepID=UPI000EFFEEA3|nr:hypothetical protein [Pseudomonas savastanoi]RMM60387.1 hypothetical protein ALQ75_02770 [Pseudomonas savastanoi pv. glycinea]RMM98925.1 hypothetical protein ALQ68_01684 [Pseudomonas savastanoi pv. glycinea]RMP90682.1 hypothetical protein ALQ13_02670 [Pseudomonas savastanoi pv. glycinea]RMQ90060.1 hypothetical protein ALP96_03873 [Pseudomonas savastanoi pv. glycinea]RMQ95234.1 hypothetical protein ALP95_03413 [Pseudomonas savastanoi pv. glycinea]
MKIWAYAKGSDGYVTLEDGRLKFFFVWQVLKMKRENPQQFSSLTFISTQWREKYRREMFAVKNGYFRYKSAEPVSRSGDSDGETLPHAYLIAVLSQLQTINFKIGDEVVPFTFTRLVAEETRLRFGNGNGYVPDLYGEFTSDNPYYKKWGGKVAIEVCYSNPCSMHKVVDFRDHGIPIIEIKIAKSINIETYIDKNDIEGSIERGYQKITDIASNQLFCRVLSDPVSTRFHDDFAKQAERDRVALVEKNKRETMFLFNKLREAESLTESVGKERDGYCEAKGLLEKDKAGLEASTIELNQNVENLKIELGKYKTAYTNKVNEIKTLKGELEDAKAGFLTKVWRAISSEKA